MIFPSEISTKFDPHKIQTFCLGSLLVPKQLQISWKTSNLYHFVRVKNLSELVGVNWYMVIYRNRSGRLIEAGSFFSCMEFTNKLKYIRNREEFKHHNFLINEYTILIIIFYEINSWWNLMTSLSERWGLSTMWRSLKVAEIGLSQAALSPDTSKLRNHYFYPNQTCDKIRKFWTFWYFVSYNIFNRQIC